VVQGRGAKGVAGLRECTERTPRRRQRARRGSNGVCERGGTTSGFIAREREGGLSPRTPDIDVVCTTTGLGRRARQRGKTRADQRVQQHAVGGEGWRDTWRGAQDVSGRGRPGEGAASGSARARTPRQQRGAAWAWARLNVSVCLSLTTFFSKILNRSAQSGK
jgi:hypothetical protein